ncbi:competence/damage-inducible protein A [Candidatus Acetothermia bacterium]|nr:competence/damage-inducible protein A [Candidatus Acetothermia bacterium]
MNEKAITVSIITIGNELLLGQVQDTNTHWLCKQITGLGGSVMRVVLVRDEIEAIVKEIRAALAEKFSLIITSGGLGPTPDDLTLSAVAEALDRRLALNSEARCMVAERIQQLYDAKLIPEGSMTPSREKMAWLPEGALPLANHQGTAPGVLIKEVDASTIVSLPGVPAEMKDIFSDALQPFLNSLFGASFYLEKILMLQWNDESALAPLLKEVSERWPQVYVKSRAKSFERGFRILLSISMSSKRDLVPKEVDAVKNFLSEQLTQRKIVFEELANDPRR